MKQISVLLFILFSIGVNSLELTKRLEPYALSCFQDSLGEMILIHMYASVRISNKQIKFYIEKPDKSLLVSQEIEHEINYQVVTEQEGDYTFCFENLSDQETIDVDFDYKTGAEAKDYSNLVQKEKGVQFHVSAQKLEDTLHDINLEKRLILRHQEYNSTLQKEISFKIMAFSVITTLLLLALALFQVFYLKQFFQQRKII